MPGPVREEMLNEEKFPINEPIVGYVGEEDEQEDDAEFSDDGDDEDDDTLGASESSRQSRSEKKIRKAMLKLGMKPITDVSMVTIKRAKDMYFFMSKPDVFKSPNSETYVMFGEAKIDDLNSQLQNQAAQQFRMPDMGSLVSKNDVAAQADEEEEVDDTGILAQDIEWVMTQAGVSKAEAVKALKSQNGDIVSAIMELTC